MRRIIIESHGTTWFPGIVRYHSVPPSHANVFIDKWGNIEWVREPEDGLYYIVVAGDTLYRPLSEAQYEATLYACRAILAERPQFAAAFLKDARRILVGHEVAWLVEMGLLPDEYATTSRGKLPGRAIRQALRSSL